MSFEDCLGLVHLRGTLFDEIAPVTIEEAELEGEMGDAQTICAAFHAF